MGAIFCIVDAYVTFDKHMKFFSTIYVSETKKLYDVFWFVEHLVVDLEQDNR